MSVQTAKSTQIAELQSFLQHVDREIESGQLTQAMRLILSNFGKFPDTTILRERVATALASRGRKKEAAAIYALAARHYANAGYPSRSLAAIKQLSTVRPDVSIPMDHFCSLYHIRSPHIGDVRIKEYPLPDGPLDRSAKEPQLSESELLTLAADRASEKRGVITSPQQLPALPFLSLLPMDNLRKVLDSLDYEIFAQSQDILKPGEFSTDLIWSVSADLMVRQEESFGRLPENTLVGLNGFGRPRVASSTVLSAPKGAQILRLSAKAIRDLNMSMPDFANRIATLRRHALTERLLCTHHFFSNLSEEHKMLLMERFIGVHVPEGEKLIRQKTASPGLFILLDGKADVVRKDDQWEITIASLKAGDLCGEIGLISDSSATADVITTAPCIVLFLSREAFNQSARELPELAKYAANLASTRLAEQSDTLSASDLSEIE